jgi:hypothetical protein
MLRQNQYPVYQNQSQPQQSSNPNNFSPKPNKKQAQNITDGINLNLS